MKIFKSYKILYKLSLILVSCFAYSAQAQQEQMYSHYDYNSLALNPAYAGSKRTLVANSLARYQWLGFAGAPTYYNLGVHGPVMGDFAAGLNIQTGKIGKFRVASPLSETQIAASFAYNKRITENFRLAAGLRFGLYNYNMQLSKLDGVSGDNAFIGNDYNLNAPMLGGGLYLYSEKVFFGASLPRMVFVPQNMKSNINVQYAAVNQYYLMAGMVYDLTDDIKLKPTTQIKFASGMPMQIDLNLHAIYKDNYSLGVFFRNGGDVGLMAMANVANCLNIVYSYDSKIGQPMNNYIKQSHEIGIQYMLPYVPNSRVRVPRYF